MKLEEIYLIRDEKDNGTFKKNAPTISFEVFPPKDDATGEKVEKLLNHLSLLKCYNPALVSVTYGAGGSNQSKSLEILKKVVNSLEINAMPHFTCVCTKKEMIKDYLKEIQELGVKNILALRGDIPEGMSSKDFDFHYANELVEFIKSETDLSIGVAGYPEGHMECENLEKDLQNLKQKVLAGASAIYTQMFFDNNRLFEFIEKVENLGLSVPVIPGILPISSYNQLQRMLSMAKVSIPKALMNKLEKYKENPDDVKKIGIDFASSQCQNLIENNIAGLHFYTLNTSTSVKPILENLGF